MRIQYKIILLIGGITIFFILVFIILWNSEKIKYDLLLEETLKERKYLFDVTIDLLGRNLEQFAYDYSFWDEMCDFVNTRDPKFAHEMIETGVNTYNSNFVWIFDKEFNMVYSFNNLKSNDLLRFPYDKDILKQIFEKNKFNHFYFLSPEGVIETRTAPIQPSSDIHRLSEPRGYLIIGRLWNNTVTDHLKKLTTSDIFLERVINVSSDTITQSNKTYRINKILNDWDGKPIINLISEVEFSFLEKTEEYLKSQFILLLIFTIIILLSITTFFLKYINKPFKLLTRSLSDSNPEYIKDLVYQKDEFGKIAKLISDFFTQKKQLEDEIIEREEINAKLTESERRIRDILTNLNLIALTLDEKGNVTFCNNFLLKLTGWQREEIINKNWFDNFLPEDERFKIKEMFLNNIMSGTIQANIDYCIIDQNANRKLISWSNTILKDIKGKVIGIASIGKDITEQKKAEENLKKAKEEAEHANRAKTVFLANMSHELKTPLVGILGFAEILMTRLKDKEYKEKAEFIYNNGQRLLETLNALLELSTVEANKLQVNMEPVDVVSLVSEVKKLYDELATKNNLSLKIYVTNKNIYSITDKKLLRQILNNLISNAIKYTEQGSVTISVFKEKKDWVVIKITDTGIGIPPEYQSIIFEPFRQVSEGLSRKYEGTGLGLAITKHFVEAIEGTISLQSEVGKGSSFEVKIPAIDAKDIDEKKIISTSANDFQYSEEDLEKFKSKKILVVENDKSTLQLFNSLLTEYFQVDTIDNGTEAVQICKSNNYDLILMDISLKKDMNGLEAKEKIREIKNYKNIPIIAITAHAMVEEKVELLKEKFDDYIEKPFSNKELLKTIFKTLKKIR